MMRARRFATLLSPPFQSAVRRTSMAIRRTRSLLLSVASAGLFGLVLLVGFTAQVSAAPKVSTTIVISQVYGGGGNSGATYKNDFIEIFNRGAAPVSVTGWSVQY